MPETTLTKRLAAILAADVAGYSRLMATDERATVAALDAARTVFRAKVEAHQGRVVDMAGDAVLAVFGTAAGAVSAGLAIQHELNGSVATIPEELRMRFRIGVHLGDVFEKPDGTIYGDGVNIAARLEGLAEPGGLTVSDAVHGAVRGKVEASFVDRGMHQVKNIPHPVHAYSAHADGSTMNAPAASIGAGTMKAASVSPIDLPLADKSSIALPLPDKPSIAVLAFENMSGDPEQAYFSDGIVEDVITALSRFKQLFVIARNSSFSYKGRNVDVKQVGRELGVRYVLEGSVRKAGGRVRITGQLIDALTGAHLWADRFDGELADIFDLQDQVTARVVGEIIPKLDEAEIERALRKPTDNLEAYDYYLRGLAQFRGPYTREANDAALQLLYTSVSRDPKFALTEALVAQCFLQRKTRGWMTDVARETAEAARAAYRAIELGKDDAVALAYGAHALAYVVGDLDIAASACERALSLNPNVAFGWGSSGYISVLLGQPEKGIEHVQRAIRLSPRDPNIGVYYMFAAMTYRYADRDDEAVYWAQRAVRENPESHVYLRAYAATLATVGRLDEARKVIDRLCQLAPTLSISSLGDVMPPFRRATDREKYIESLRKAGLPE